VVIRLNVKLVHISHHHSLFIAVIRPRPFTPFAPIFPFQK